MSAPEEHPILSLAELAKLLESHQETYDKVFISKFLNTLSSDASRRNYIPITHESHISAEDVVYKNVHPSLPDLCLSVDNLKTWRLSPLILLTRNIGEKSLALADLIISHFPANELPDDSERAARIETAATELFVVAWDAINDGSIPLDSPLATRVGALGRALNPNWVEPTTPTSPESEV